MQSHDIVQVQGCNGSGKTSLLRILCGLAQPVSGSVRWNNTDVHEDGHELHQQLIYIGHRRGVCEDLTPLENLRFSCDITTPTSTSRARAALAQFGLEHVAGEVTRLLSAGQLQRTALARLLVNNAQLWCLDEPFTALDEEGRAVVEAIITENAANGGICFVATHQPMNIPTTSVKILDLDAL